MPLFDSLGPDRCSGLALQPICCELLITQSFLEPRPRLLIRPANRAAALQAAHPLRSPQHPTAVQPVARPVELIGALDQIQRAADARQAIEQGLLQLGIEQHRAPQGEPHPKHGQ